MVSLEYGCLPFATRVLGVSVAHTAPFSGGGGWCCGVIKHFKVGIGVRSQSNHKGFLVNINVEMCQFLVGFRKRSFCFFFVYLSIHNNTCLRCVCEKNNAVQVCLFFDFVSRSSDVRRQSPRRYSVTTALDEIANPDTCKLLKTTTTAVFGRQHPTIR